VIAVLGTIQECPRAILPIPRTHVRCRPGMYYRMESGVCVPACVRAVKVMLPLLLLLAHALAACSYFFTMSKAISISTGPIFTIFSPYKSTLRAYDGTVPYFPIYQESLPWQLNNVAVMKAN